MKKHCIHFNALTAYNTIYTRKNRIDPFMRDVAHILNDKKMMPRFTPRSSISSASNEITRRYAE